MAHLSRWLAEQKLDVTDLTPAVGTAFLAMRRAAGYRLWLSPKALEPLLQYLQRLGALPPEPVVTPRDLARTISRVSDVRARAHVFDSGGIHPLGGVVPAQLGATRRHIGASDAGSSKCHRLLDDRCRRAWLREAGRDLASLLPQLPPCREDHRSTFVRGRAVCRQHSLGRFAPGLRTRSRSTTAGDL